MISTSLNQTLRKMGFKFRCRNKKWKCVRIKVDSNGWNFPLTLIKPNILLGSFASGRKNDVFCLWSLIWIHWRAHHKNITYLDLTWILFGTPIKRFDAWKILHYFINCRPNKFSFFCPEENLTLIYWEEITYQNK